MNNQDVIELRLLTIIVKNGLGSKVLKLAKKCGASGGTILYGRGTVKNWLLELLDITDTKKEIVIIGCRKDTYAGIVDVLNKALQFEKPNHGIAFTTRVKGVYGSKGVIVAKNPVESRSEENYMYTQILVIVDKGKAENVIESAVSAGSRGGTIINARGSGIHETSMLFSMEIEPEKEIVLILAENNVADNIIDKISEDQKLSEPGNGIIFAQEVIKTYGIVQ